MTIDPRAVELALSLALTGSFALVGDLLLGRRSRGMFQWNESFLVGCGVSAALLFPLSLLLPNAALDVLAAGLFLLAAVQAVRRFTQRPQIGGAETVTGALREDLQRWPAWVLLALTVLAWLGFAVLDLKGLFVWDGFQIWATKAMVLVHDGGLRPELWEAGERYGRIGRVAAYPQLVPMFEALLSVIRGGFDFEAVKPVFLVFHTSLLVSVYRAAKGLAPSPTRLVTPLLVALLPMISTGPAAGGYADMPLAAYLAAVIAAVVHEGKEPAGWRSPAPWLIGSLTLVKSEGMILLAVVCAALLVRPMAAGPRALAGFLRRRWRAIAPIALLIALRVGYVSWAHFQDPEFSFLGPGTAARALARVPVVAQLTLVEMIDIRKWGLLWLAALVCGAILLIRGTAAERALLLGTSLAIVAYSAIFLWTNWTAEVHFWNAHDRLLSQLAPMVVLVIVCGFERLRALAGPRLQPGSGQVDRVTRGQPA